MVLLPSLKAFFWRKPAGHESAERRERAARDGDRVSVPDRGHRETQTGAGLTVVGDDLIATPATRSDLAAAEQALNIEGAASTSAAASTLSAWLFLRDQAPREVPIAELAAHSAAGHFRWLDVSNYAPEELHAIAAQFDLPISAVRIALRPWQRPRLSIYPDHFFVSSTVARPDVGSYHVHAGELDLFVGCNLVVSAHKLPLPFADQLRARVQQSPELVRIEPAFLVYVILDELLAYYGELVRQLQHEVESIEERALQETTDAFLEDLLRFKRYASALSLLASEHREVFEAFVRPDFQWVSGEQIQESFRDLDARLTRLLTEMGAVRDAANGALDIHVSHVAHRTNQVIKVLTMASIVLFLASVLIALFGSNLQSIATSGALVFSVMVVSIVASVGTTFIVFQRRGWL
jgi:magnesium transporter